MANKLNAAPLAVGGITSCNCLWLRLWLRLCLVVDVDVDVLDGGRFSLSEESDGTDAEDTEPADAECMVFSEVNAMEGTVGARQSQYSSLLKTKFRAKV